MLLDVNDLLGKPYQAHARGPNAYDCYGLVIEVEKRLGREMPDLYKRLADGEDRDFDPHDVSISSQISGIVKTDTPSFGDVVLFFDDKGRIFHTGVYLKEDDMIHCNKRGVHIIKFYEYSNRSEVYTWQK